MPKKKSATRPTYVVAALRFRSIEQRELIQEAAFKADTSMNSFIRVAAEKAARAVLASGESYKDHNNAQD